MQPVAADTGVGALQILATHNGTHAPEYWAQHIVLEFVPLLKNDPVVHALVVAARQQLYETIVKAVQVVRNAEAIGLERDTEYWVDLIARRVVKKVQALNGDKPDYDVLYDRTAEKLRYWVNSICHVERQTRADLRR